MDMMRSLSQVLFRALTLHTERTLSAADLGLGKVEPADIYRGSTVEEAAGIF